MESWRILGRVAIQYCRQFPGCNCDHYKSLLVKVLDYPRSEGISIQNFWMVSIQNFTDIFVHFCYWFSFLAIDTTKTSFPKLKNKSLFSNCCLKGSYILGAGRNISMTNISRTVRTCKDCRFCSNEFYVLFFMNQPSVKGKLNQVVSSKQKSASTDVLIDYSGLW